MGPVYTGDDNWKTPGVDIYNDLASAAGTYSFPATFTLIKPDIEDQNNWC
jgi:hypothetical protein